MPHEDEESRNTVLASPTKRFFVDMLTRDIELQDAILDLLDNCVDGILRSNKVGLDLKQPYEDFFATIEFDEHHFSIEDNCGGIPIDLAKRYAFMMGRPRDEGDTDIPTVGMYGIGMKRAIFKMGRYAEVTSQTNDQAFKVTIRENWLSNDQDWELPLENIGSPFNSSGTKIYIAHLVGGIAKLFTSDGTSPFEKQLLDTVTQHYSFILKKGFKILINGKAIKPKDFNLLWTEETDNSRQTIAPYLYKATLNGVEVKLAVGFYRPMLDPDELSEEEQTRRSKEDAGWTIICNDRVVVYNDKSRLTGWGEAGVPDYHSQFIGIFGIVSFTCNDAWKLPLTTTKRGIDSTELYLYIKEFMREGLKKFTKYTNDWKVDPSNEKKISLAATPKSIEEIFKINPDDSWTKVKNKDFERKLNIPLAAPVEANPRKQIKFSKFLTEIELVSDYFFDAPDVPPSQVGMKCFETILEKANESNGRG